MAEHDIHEAKKPRIAQVIALNFIESTKILEFVYDSITKGCKTPGHSQKLYDRLYVIPCTKILEWHYFHTIFKDTTSRVELTVHTKQQYYVYYCHKICGDCMQRSLRCSICKKISNLHFSEHTKYIFDTSINKDTEIWSLYDFHDIFQELEIFLTKKKRVPFIQNTSMYIGAKKILNYLFSRNST